MLLPERLRARPVDCRGGQRKTLDVTRYLALMLPAGLSLCDNTAS
jgi:hypothetical protein